MILGAVYPKPAVEEPASTGNGAGQPGETLTPAKPPQKAGAEALGSAPPTSSGKK
jgi:hypothetical protein